MSRFFCGVYCLSTRTDKITSLHQNYQCHGSGEFNNCSTVGNFKFCLVSLLYQCIAVALYLRTWRHWPHPTLVTLLAKRTYISEDYYYWYVSLQCYETDTEATTKYTGKVIRQIIWNYLQYHSLLNWTLQWRWQFWRNNVILSVQVLVKVVGVSLLKVISTGITVF